jgi:hypothetical protein
VGKALVAFILLALATFCGIGRAQAACAQSTSDPAAFYCATAAEAYAGAIDITVSQSDLDYVCGSPTGQSLGAVGANGGGQNTFYIGWFDCSINKIHRSSSRVYNYAQQCQTGAVWNDASHTCGAPFDSAACLAHNSEPGFVGVGTITRPAEHMCAGGCDFSASPAQGVVTVGGIGGGMTAGTYEFSGNACQTPTAPAQVQPLTDPPPTPKPSCVPSGSGQTFCLKPNGQHCYSASTGREICWRPGETGTKTDGPDVQVRAPGTTPPALPPSPPDTTFNSKPPVTITTTTTINNVTTTTTTTVSSGTTSTNTEAGATNQGGPSSNGTTGTGTSPDADKKGNGSSGGGDCVTSPVNTGDPLLSQIATQAWATRCAVEAGNSAKVTGDVANCASPFTVEGTNANAVKLRGLRAQICGTAKSDGAIDHTGDAVGPETGMTDPAPAVAGGDGLDHSGFGYGTACPAPVHFTYRGQEFRLTPDGMCEWFQVGGWFVILLTGIACARLMAVA